ISKNEIRLDLESPILYGLQQAKTYNDTVPPYCRRSVQHDEYYVQFI
ncbi:unnamed protein product, partial [Rotaria sordida]